MKFEKFKKSEKSEKISGFTRNFAKKIAEIFTEIFTKKICAALCLFAVLASSLSLASCSESGGEADDAPESLPTDTAAESGDAERDYVIVENNFSREVRTHLNSIGKDDFDGAAIMIATPKESLINEDVCGAAMAKAVKDRNDTVENWFNVSIYSKATDVGTMYDELSNSVRAGDYYADIIMIPQNQICSFAVSGLLFNLAGLPFSNFGAGYNIESGVASAMAKSTGYAVAGWASLDADSLSAVFFNRALVSDTGLGDPYSLVRRGEWTWDKFFEYTNAVGALNEKRAQNSLERIYSYGSQDTSLRLADLVFVSEGTSFVTGGGLGGTPYVSVSYENTLHAATTAQTLYTDENKNYNSMDAVSLFASGGSMFLIERLSTAKALAVSDAEWGILPLPKASSEQENYRTLTSEDSLFFAVPSNCNNAQTVSRVLSALNAASLGYMADAHITDYMYYYLRDNDSVEMMEKIFYSAYYDMAYTLAPYSDSVPNSTYFAARNVYELNHDMTFYLSRFEYGANLALDGFFD